MATKGWRPGGSGESRVGDSPATRRRRRRENEAEQAETPNVVEMRRAAPRVHTGDRPPPGKHDKTGDTRPNMRIELGKRWTQIVTEVKAGQYTWAEFCDGLDEHELARGQLRATDGSFTGRPPRFVPREFLLAAQREQKRRFEEIFGSEVLGIASEYVKLCRDANIPAKDRAKMMQYAMERIFGGIPKEIKVAQEQPWETMVVNVHADEGGMPEHVARRYAGYAEREGSDGSD